MNKQQFTILQTQAFYQRQRTDRVTKVIRYFLWVILVGFTASIPFVLIMALKGDTMPNNPDNTKNECIDVDLQYEHLDWIEHELPLEQLLEEEQKWEDRKNYWELANSKY